MEGLDYAPEGNTNPTESLTIIPKNEIARHLPDTTLVIDEDATYVELTSTEGDIKKQIVAKVKIKNGKVEMKKISPTGGETDIAATDISPILLEKLKRLGNRSREIDAYRRNNTNLTGNIPQEDLHAKPVTQTEIDLAEAEAEAYLKSENIP